ncbi:bacteriohemerythrin [Magnetofaba australis]|uniref:Putative hemerythrin-like, metal-binding (MHR) protein n=1 Tax=Magnetofaba australis IT-1 TaxID=1434232 RepID=A0A1Y2K2Q7_9PROT|nr:hemerythrin domain-containing protein [Magnetofaba australis]OSM02293.1 putative hemerythrin-like, metal-binding (MHR) protein [Magnetofaba australis IT-1]
MSKYPIRLTGNEQIDDDHRELWELFQSIKAAPKDQERVLESMRLLSDGWVEHFKREEAVMAQAGYPGLEAHKTLHRQYHERILEFQKNLEQRKEMAQSEWERMLAEAKLEAGLEVVTECSTCIKVAAFLTQWFLQHTNFEDQKYVAYLKSASGA